MARFGNTSVGSRFGDATDIQITEMKKRFTDAGFTAADVAAIGSDVRLGTALLVTLRLEQAKLAGDRVQSIDANVPTAFAGYQLRYDVSEECLHIRKGEYTAVLFRNPETPGLEWWPLNPRAAADGVQALMLPQQVMLRRPAGASERLEIQIDDTWVYLDAHTRVAQPSSPTVIVQSSITGADWTDTHITVLPPGKDYDMGDITLFAGASYLQVTYQEGRPNDPVALQLTPAWQMPIPGLRVRRSAATGQAVYQVWEVEPTIGSATIIGDDDWGRWSQETPLPSASSWAACGEAYQVRSLLDNVSLEFRRTPA